MPGLLSYCRQVKLLLLLLLSPLIQTQFSLIIPYLSCAIHLVTSRLWAVIYTIWWLQKQATLGYSCSADFIMVVNHGGFGFWYKGVLLILWVCVFWWGFEVQWVLLLVHLMYCFLFFGFVYLFLRCLENGSLIKLVCNSIVFISLIWHDFI